MFAALQHDDCSRHIRALSFMARAADALNSMSQKTRKLQISDFIANSEYRFTVKKAR